MIMILIIKKSSGAYWCVSVDLNSWSAADLYCSGLPCKRADGVADGIVRSKRRIADEQINLCAIEVERKRDAI